MQYANRNLLSTCTTSSEIVLAKRMSIFYEEDECKHVFLEQCHSRHMHYENMPMKYTGIFKAVKMTNFI